MSEMVERVARIISAGMAEHLPYEDVAKAAIKAMREPTKTMADATDGLLGGYGDMDDDCWQADPTEVWRAMIDEALK